MLKHASQMYMALLSSSLSLLASVREEGETQRDIFFIMSEKCDLLCFFGTHHFQTIKCSLITNACDQAVDFYSRH